MYLFSLKTQDQFKQLKMNVNLVPVNAIRYVLIQKNLMNVNARKAFFYKMMVIHVKVNFQIISF